MVPFSAPVQSKAGAEYRLVINPQAPCYCYVVVQSSDGGAVVLYAGALAKGAWASPIMKFTDPPGSESLFIVVSRDC